MADFFQDDFTKNILRIREKTMGDNLRKRNAVPVGSMLKLFLHDSGLLPQWNAHRIAEAWNKASGAGAYTLSTHFAAGVLYCSLSSSVLRNQLYFQRTEILEALNRILLADEMFTPPADGSAPVKALVLK